MEKRGDVGFEFIVKIIITLVVLVVVLGIIIMIFDKSYSIVDKIKNIFWG
ncbi:hypothetical protein HYS48_05390 [Candidatus Woesearchaeota archaeon]|nr:hypothetical protein [Candidatus Woesearchaeota archaeon]